MENFIEQYTEEDCTYYVVKKAFVEEKLLYETGKRIFDFTAAMVMMILLLLPMLLIAVYVKLDSYGSAIYKQERIGLNGKPFTIYKFRTMYVNAEENGPQWAEKIDYRCTRAGHVLRKTRLDELPQLWNIITGDMSFVGPRPERAYFYDQFEQYIHGFKNRLSVKPGLTGWAQVNGGYDLQPEEKIVYDMEYIESRSFGIDMKCIFMTIRLVFTHEGAR